MTRAKQKSLGPIDGAELLKREVFMAQRLKAHGCDVFAGSSDTASRKACFRRVITERGLEHTILARDTSGHCVTYAQAFERTYGESLAPQATRPSSSTQPDARQGNSTTIANGQEKLL